MIVATKLVCGTLIPLGNMYYQFKHEKQTFSKCCVSVNDKLGC